MNQSNTIYTPEQIEWIRKVQKICNFNQVTTTRYKSPFTMSQICKRSVEFVLEDNGEMLFNFNKGGNKNLASIIYLKTKEWGKDVLNKLIFPNNRHERYIKSFMSIMRRYRKEYRKHLLVKYLIPQARRKVINDILYCETNLPKDMVNDIVNYL